MQASFDRAVPDTQRLANGMETLIRHVEKQDDVPLVRWKLSHGGEQSRRLPLEDLVFPTGHRQRIPRFRVHRNAPVPGGPHLVANHIDGHAHDPRGRRVVDRVPLFHPLPNTNQDVLGHVFGVGRIAERCETHVQHLLAVARDHRV